jgi:hypothetical protein
MDRQVIGLRRAYLWTSATCASEASANPPLLASAPMLERWVYSEDNTLDVAETGRPRRLAPGIVVKESYEHRVLVALAQEEVQGVGFAVLGMTLKGWDRAWRQKARSTKPLFEAYVGRVLVSALKRVGRW